MPLTRFEECWPLPTESLPEIPYNLNIVFHCWLSVQWEPSTCRSCQCCQKKGSSKVCGWICSVWPSWVWERQLASTGNSVSWSLCHSSRSSFNRMAFFPSLKQKFIAYRSSNVQIAILKFTSWDNQALVAVPLNRKSKRLVSHLIRCIAIRYWFFKSLRQF